MAKTATKEQETKLDDEKIPEEPMTAGTDLSLVTVGGREIQAYDFGEDAGAGLEDLSMDEQLIPFMSILQGLSPQINRTKPEYIDGAGLGMILNTATKEIYDVAKEPLPVIPCWREHQFTEWVPRDDMEFPDGSVVRGGGGGGFRGIHDPNAPEVVAAREHALKIGGRTALFRPLKFHNNETNEDTVLIEQYNVGILYGWPVLDEYSVQRAMIAFTSTKISVYKAFTTTADKLQYMSPTLGRMQTAPMWAHRWRLGVIAQTNKKGDFFNFSLRLEAMPKEKSLVKRSEPLYAAGLEFYQQWKSGQARADYESAAKAAENNDSSQSGGAYDREEGGPIPF